MLLSKANLPFTRPMNGLAKPMEDQFSLPEKVLQFGTGVLLRGLPDYFIDKANRHAVFNGRIVVVKSTAADGSDAFRQQDCLYTHCIRGIENGEVVEETIINSSLSRVLSASSQWNEILACAANADMQVIISNTTEVGIVLDAGDTIHLSPPRSFPGKLLAFLYKRFQDFNGDPGKGMVIIPTELIPGNADKLFAIVVELAGRNNLDPSFIHWLNTCNYFCNSLVDRIVPGRLSAAMQESLREEAGYEDNLAIMSEVYRLWAIESAEPRVRELLSFSQVDPGVVITGDIEVFRELKLRLLNGSHTFCCGLAYLAGFKTVKEAMCDPGFAGFIEKLMKTEIVPSITSDVISEKEAMDFAASVLDRFRNPHIEHQWLSITMQYSSKMKTRNIPIIRSYLQRTQQVPECISLGFAAHLLFMKCEQAEDGRYYGTSHGEKYLVNDDQAGWYAAHWKRAPGPAELVSAVLADDAFWGAGLSTQPELINAITSKLQELIGNGARPVAGTFNQPAKPAEIS